jgi:hypothetical protein
LKAMIAASMLHVPILVLNECEPYLAGLAKVGLIGP